MGWHRMVTVSPFLAVISLGEMVRRGVTGKKFCFFLIEKK
jgi:hypothetical protein